MRVIVWFSCGAASAVAAKKAVDRYDDIGCGPMCQTPSEIKDP